MTGSYKQKLLVIGKSKTPRCFKNVKNLTVDYKSNKKAWMTGDIFSDWLKEWDKQLAKEKRHILLTVDNYLAHPPVETEFIKLVFLPPNTTSLLQPMDQGRYY
ncbi:tigger transposable element-derived protein 4-like [Acyrthosiphon pisum]|uniref:DDE-1 domain-containing protein n=1 Tax=Acyrthosiphon pisum TaxID=7029 RepID=A0A8R2FCI3_ACYPI|nr:tigger transposable element-derived protein 4-like [Acyrthosiphon pisum]|eukprot:XP_008187780.1 PREDICTED: tigger transposable element-derived protein 4-like [Acyrthosiphon pisum]